MLPNGKALAFGASLRWFDSTHPSLIKTEIEITTHEESGILLKMMYLMIFNRLNKYLIFKLLSMMPQFILFVPFHLKRRALKPHESFQKIPFKSND